MAATQLTPEPTLSNRKLVLAGQLAFLPTGVLTTLLGPMLPILIARWAMNDTQAGNLFLVQFLAMLAGVQLSGLLLSRVGYRPAFLSGLLLMACGTATIYLGALWLGLASVATFGLGLGLIIPTDNLLIAEISAGPNPGSSSGAVSLLNFFWGVGAVFCSLMVAWTEAHKFLPLFLVFVALFLVLWPSRFAICLFRRQRRSPPSQRLRGAGWRRRRRFGSLLRSSFFIREWKPQSADGLVLTFRDWENTGSPWLL